MKLTREKIILSFVFAVATFFWVYFVIVTGYSESDLGLYLQIPLAIIPLIGGVFGIKKAEKWGGNKSVIGRAIMSLSLGMLTWTFGMIVWNYYIFFTDVEIPYPSMSDVFFIISWPLWTFGVYELAKAAGAGYGLKLKSGKYLFLFIPLIVIALSYYLLFVVARGGEFDTSAGFLRIFVDLFYPIGDIVILTVATLVYSLSRKFLGGAYKPAVLLLILGYVCNYFTDFTFSYTNTVGTYFNGHFVDYMFTTTMFVMSYAILSFDPDNRK